MTISRLVMGLLVICLASTAIINPLLSALLFYGLTRVALTLPIRARKGEVNG